MEARAFLFSFSIIFGILTDALHLAAVDVKRSPNKVPQTDRTLPQNALISTTISPVTDAPLSNSEHATKLRSQLQELENMKLRLQKEVATGIFSKRKEEILNHIDRQILLREKQLVELRGFLEKDSIATGTGSGNSKQADILKLPQIIPDVGLDRHQEPVQNPISQQNELQQQLQQQQQQQQQQLQQEQQLLNLQQYNNLKNIFQDMGTTNKRVVSVPDLTLSDMSQFQALGSGQPPLAAINTGAQHVFVPLDSFIQRQIFPQERYIIINQPPLPNKKVTAKTTEASKAPVATVNTTPMPKVKTTMKPRPRTTASSDEEGPIPPASLVLPITLSPDAIVPQDAESMKKDLLQTELKKQKLEIKKLQLEIRALQRTEYNMYSGMGGMGGGDSEDGPQRKPFGFGGGPMMFPFMG